MYRSNYDKDNISQGQKSLHTYTPGSHENLLRSHLQLDNEKQARLQNNVKRLAQENDNLKRDLDDAQRDIQKKDDEINDLRNQLRNKPRTDPYRPQEPDQSPVYELDGQPVTLDGLINHFNVIIQRHHDLLQRKNQEIRDLQDALDQANKRPPVREASRPNQEDIQDMLNEMARVRKEYEQANYVLSERNKKLEKLIDDLEKKLDEYSREIQQLRNQLAKPIHPSPSTLQLIRKKEEENEQLRELIRELQDKNIKQDSIKNEIRNVIASKEAGVNTINDIIYEIKNQPSTTKINSPDTSSMQNQCQKAIADLNDTNEKLNDLLRKLRNLPEEYPTSGQAPKKDLVPNLELVKNQCEDQIQTLKKLIQPPVEYKPSEPYRTNTEPYRTNTEPSRTNTEPYRTNTEPSRTNTEPEPYVKKYPNEYLDQSPSRSTIPREKEKSPYYPNNVRSPSPQNSERFVPQLAYSEPPRRKHYPSETCEACSDYPLKKAPTPPPRVTEPPPRVTEPPPRVRELSPSRVSFEREVPSKKLLGDEFYPPSQRQLERQKSREREPTDNEDDVPTRDKAKKPKKGGCCKKKPSETSNKYEKKEDKKKKKKDKSRRRSSEGRRSRESRSSDQDNKGRHRKKSPKEKVEKIHDPYREYEDQIPTTSSRQPRQR